MTRHDELALLLDHSVLKPEATAGDIAAGAATSCAQGRIGFYCVQPWWVKRAVAELAGSPARVVTVVGFPHGCDRSEVKARRRRWPSPTAPREIDMVLNFGALKSGESVPVAPTSPPSSARPAPRRSRSSSRPRPSPTPRSGSPAALPSRPAPPSSRPRPGFIRPAAPRVDDVRLLRDAGGIPTGRQGVGRHTQPRRHAGDARRRRQSYRHFGQRRHPGGRDRPLVAAPPAGARLLARAGVACRRPRTHPQGLLDYLRAAHSGVRPRGGPSVSRSTALPCRGQNERTPAIR